MEGFILVFMRFASQHWRLFLVFAAPLALWWVPVPHGVEPAGWHAMALFVGFIVGCVLNAAALGSLSLLLMAVLVVTRSMPLATVLSGFANSGVWLALMAFFLAIGFRKTPFGERLSYLFIRRFGRHPLGLAYSLTASNLLITPFVPNGNARGVGICFPVTEALSTALGSRADDGTQRRIGSFLMLVSYHQNLITGAMFLTGMSTNPVVTSMYAKAFGVDISWLQWLWYSCAPMAVLLLIAPALIYVLHRPEMTAEETIRSQDFAREKLTEMGKVSLPEWSMAGTFSVLIVLWATAQWTKLDATTVVLLGVVSLLGLRVISYDDIVKDHRAWDILLWLAPLIALTAYLSKTGVLTWLMGLVKQRMGHTPLWLAFLVLAVLYYYIHYFLTSIIVHVQTFLLPVLGILVSMGAPAVGTGMIFAWLTTLSPATTHYGTGAASVYFGAGYVTQREWWRVGFIVSVVEVTLAVGLGVAWLTALGRM